MLGRLGHIACALALLAGGAVAGCGEDDSTRAGPAALAPPDAPLFAEAVIRPEGEQADAIESLAERIGGVSDPGPTLIALLDEFLAANGLDASYADDVEPWLGARGAVFVSSFEPTGGADSPDVAVVVEVDDADGAREFLGDVVEASPDQEEERSYEGTEYYGSANGFAAGVVDDTGLVFATENAFQVAVDSSQGESLAESAEYAERIDALPADAVGSVFFEPGETVEAIFTSEGVDPAQARMWTPLLDGLLSEPVAAALTANSGAAAIDVAAITDSDAISAADSSLISDLPAEAWLAVAVPDLGRAVRHGLDQLTASGLPGVRDLERRILEMTGLELDGDALDWLGDAAGFVAGTSPSDTSVGLIAETNDPDAPRAVIAALRRLAEVEAAVVGDTFVAVRGATVAEARDPSRRLADEMAFHAATIALGDFPAGLYVNLPSLFDVAEQGSDGDIDYDALRPYLGAFSALVAGTRVEGDLVLTRLAVTLAPE